MAANECRRRRDELMRLMGAEGIALLPAAPERRRNRDVFHPYRQDSDFWYLTGFGEPDAVAVLAPGRDQGQFLLFCRERDPAREVWEGATIGQERAVSDYGADDAFPISDIDDIVPGLLEGRSRVYGNMGADPAFDQRLFGWINQVRAGRSAGPPGEYVALQPLLHEMRLIKSRNELTTMRRAAQVSHDAHREAMRQVRPGMAEYELEALFQGRFRSHNGWPAYPPIVGGGANACTLHYITNDATLRDGDLVLIDAGVELGNYASDVTRTFPVNGRFSEPQRAVYEVVLRAQQAAIEAVHPDNHWNRPHEAATRVLVDGMLDLGLLSGDAEAIIDNGDYRRFFMHRTGHWLGMDVHDVGDYRVDGHWRQLEPGQVMTIEPGLYIPPDSDDVPERFRGIGVRIEDDVAVTKTGGEILGRNIAPKQVDDIEALMSS